MGGFGIFAWIAIGVIASWTVTRLMVGPEDDALRGTAAGMIGAVLGGLGMRLLDGASDVSSGGLNASIAALAGALWLTWITCVVTTRRERDLKPPHPPERRFTRADPSAGSSPLSAFAYARLRNQLVDQLLRDAMAHDAERYDDVGQRYTSVERELPVGSAPELQRLRVALTFWDGWIDERDRGWPSDGGIARAEWPFLARTIAADLEGDRDVSDARIVARFDVVRFQLPGARARATAARLRAG